ncbi:MAG: hypothetical protein JWL59_922 [Chthoniobacteraceae bacterium]|nr:hypothetical protein [Chthoniobacteraceae bacterium]
MRFLLFASLLLSAGLAADGAEATGAQLFENEVWPLLESSCLRCHGAEKQKADLRLDSREAALKGGESGPAIVAGNPGESLLLKLVRHTEADRKMPPKEKLPDGQIASLEQWIADGAPWPARTAADALPSPKVSAGILGDAWSDPRNPIVKIFAGQRLDLWSLKPIALPVPPPVMDNTWPRNPIDRFVLEKFETARLAPAPEADARTLCRRLYFDLTGLPPAPEEMAAFLQSAASDRATAIETTVDALLASPRYGEHWARMWLDVVRYSDSNGFDWDEFRPQAWRFRDYVVRSFNSDKPFDRFIREQLAGDEMVADAPRNAAEQDCLVATGFLRLGPHDNSAALFGEGPRVRAALMNDLVETTGSAFLGLTLSCCRCHNHKFDPVSQADYYRLRAFFEGVKFRDDLPLDLETAQAEIRHRNAQTEALLVEKRKIRDAIAEPTQKRLRAERKGKLSEEEQALLRLAKPDEETTAKIKVLEKTITPSAEEVKAALGDAEKVRYTAADREIKALKEKQLPFTTGLVASDENPPSTHLLFQGDLTKPREIVAPGFLSVLDPNPADIAPPARNGTTGRRSALAAWLVSGRNPLTARVIVNRIWQGHFGEGLVATPNDFGFSGTRPLNPALLDWLASELVKSGWSLKKLHRLIVTSATYLQGAPVAGSGGSSPRRLGAEALRDSMLAVAGRLHSSAGGPPVWPAVPDELLRANPAVLDDNAEKTKGWYPSSPDQLEVRSLYLVQKRGLRVPLMETFDLPDNALSCPRRNVSTVAPQALTLLNSPFATGLAKAFAERLENEAGVAPDAQVERAFAAALQRAPDEEERLACLRFRAEHGLIELCRALLNLNEFVYVD